MTLNLIFDYEVLNSKNFNMLAEEYSLESVNSIKSYFLTRSSLCSKKCLHYPLKEFTECHDQCFKELNKRIEVGDYNKLQMETIFLGDQQNKEINKENNVHKKMSQHLDFPNHMYSGNNSDPQIKETSQDTMFGRNKAFSGKKSKNKLFSEGK